MEIHIGYKILFSIIIFITAILPGLYPFIMMSKGNNIRVISLCSSLSAGIFLGSGLIHMLSDASSSFAMLGYDYPLAYVISGFIFLVMLLLEQFAYGICESKSSSLLLFPIITTFLLSIHSFLAGVFLGATNDINLIFIAFSAIILHKWAASFALSVYLNSSNILMKFRVVFFTIFICMTPLGVLFGSMMSSFMSINSLLTSIFNSAAAGTFIYLGTLHGLKSSALIGSSTFKKLTWVFIGFMVMSLLALWV